LFFEMRQPTKARVSAGASSRPVGDNVPCLAVVIPTVNERANVPLLATRLEEALASCSWEAIFVDDDSVDGTMSSIRILSQRDPRIRGIRRIGRRGLSGAVIEGILSTSAEFIAVMDADLQHDETCLVQMLAFLKREEADVVVASRYVESGNAERGFSRWRQLASRLANQVAQLVCGQPLSDPMSGFFMLHRQVVEDIARDLSPSGFKILLDILASSRRPLRVHEIGIVFRPRANGESKFDPKVVLDYLGLVLSKLSGGLLSVRFLKFGLVGGSGLLIHLAFLWALISQDIFFPFAQTTAAIVAMTSNYLLNNALTYHDRRRQGWQILTGFVSFGVFCSIGMAMGVGIATQLYNANFDWWMAGMAGALIAAIWNFAMTASFTWPD
jgi:dolichol-phosphate mannosyltransferase